MPVVNWLLAIGTLGAVITFGSSDSRGFSRATVVATDGDKMRTLRQGKNEYTCVPDDPGSLTSWWAFGRDCSCPVTPTTC